VKFSEVYPSAANDSGHRRRPSSASVFPDWVALSNRDGTFRLTTDELPAIFGKKGRLFLPEVYDLNNDGRADMIWSSDNTGYRDPIVALSNGDGTFKVVATRDSGCNFSTPKTNPVNGAPVPFLADEWIDEFGYFNDDAYLDWLLQTGEGHFLVLSNGDGSVKCVKTQDDELRRVSGGGGWRLVGDFNRDCLTDLAFAGGNKWTTIPVGFSDGNGGFTVTNQQVPDFPGWAQADGAQMYVGDFVE
jgi:hypothetical protein